MLGTKRDKRIKRIEDAGGKPGYRTGLIRPLASPYGQRCAMLEPERRISPTRFVRYAIFKFGKSAEVLCEMVGRAGFEPATN